RAKTCDGNKYPRSAHHGCTWRAPLGIVYTTDANGARYCGDRRPRCVENVVRPGQSAAAEVTPSVKIIGTFPADSHPAIVYPVAATVTAKPEAVGYLAYLRSMTAKAIFEQYAFTFLIQPTSPESEPP